jgi:hypothetical protein
MKVSSRSFHLWQNNLSIYQADELVGFSYKWSCLIPGAVLRALRQTKWGEITFTLQYWESRTPSHVPRAAGECPS